MVLIHGIGEQRPLDTLRGFVEAVVQPDPADPEGARVWSKPDALSGSFDLRRFRTGSRRAHGGRGPGVDFYEYYWAHRMAGGSLSHTYQWLVTLLLRLPGSVPPKLRGLWALAWVVMGLIGGGLAALANWQPAGTLLVLATALGAVAKVVQNLAVRDYLGHAARYFDPAPPNIAVREQVRRGAVDLLEKLHTSDEYFRIIVVGHSLGSAIALDMLYHYWTLAAAKHAAPDRPKSNAAQCLERRLRNTKPNKPGVLRLYQKRVWRELQANGVPWRVTDLITLGSPLTHFPFLIGLTEKEFGDRKQQRELPCVPPMLDDDRILENANYQTADGQTRTIRQLHHAACFAACRWTNFYFPHSGLIRGDPIGGPLSDRFGQGIRDVIVATQHWRGRFNHSDYWRSDPRDNKKSALHPMEALLRCLDLNESFRRSPKGRKAKAES